MTEPIAPPPWGAIFDWDGVIVDSSHQHEQSWNQLALEEKRVLPEGHFRAGFGRRNENIIPDILGWQVAPAEIRRLSERKEELYREIVRSGAVEVLPGARSWLRQLTDAGIPCAVASSTHRANIELALELTALRPFFRAIVTSEDVSHGKPDPEVFLAAARGIGCSPQRCVVFEDAFAGIEAARNGGMRIIGVATTHPIAALSAADLAVHRLDELSLATLNAWFAV